MEETAKRLSIEVEIRQTNHEGVLVDWIQEARGTFDGIIINPGAYTHTSVALLDALASAQVPTVEVHLSNPMEREEFRHISYVGMYAEKRIVGKKLDGYTEALEYFASKADKG